MREALALAGGLAAVAAATLAYDALLDISNPATVSTTYLLVVLVVAAISTFRVAVAISMAAVLAFNFFFLPPVHTFTIADPQNWTALFAFLGVSLVASNLSAVARARTDEARARRYELARLFDLSRDVLITTEGRDAINSLARSVARRFDLAYAAIALPAGATWELFEAGPLSVTLDLNQLSLAFAGAQKGLEFDANERTYSGHRTTMAGDHSIRLVPLRVGTKPVGLLAAAGRDVEPGTLDALAAVIAIAIERASLLDERKAAEIARRGEDLKTALLASLAHDLRTPLTAIRVAASNLQSLHLGGDQLREQSALILGEAERLSLVFENILEMARIDAGAVATDLRWAHPSEIVAEARAHVERATRDRVLRVNVDPDTPVRLDPRLTAAALAHVIENAAQYAPAGSAIDITTRVADDGLTISVRDHGPGISAADLPRLFERFYRGDATKGRTTGTGMGLSIARGLLAAEHGRIWGDNAPGGGAEFTIVVPAESKTPA
jgi:two-component system, OmpR family, sensor histidine kinase KdpD